MGSRRTRGGQTLENPLIRTHRYFTFHESYSSSTRDEFRQKLAYNINQPIEAFEAINWSVMEQVVERDGFSTGHETLKNLLAAPYMLDTGNVGFVSHAWYRMFSVREHIYRELVVEFYSTFHFNHKSSDWTARTISFQLGGVPRQMSLVEFALGVGLYEPNEIHNPHFLAHISAGAVKKLSDLQIEEEWQFVAQGGYGSRTPSYRTIRDPRHRLIHRLLTFTIVGRRESYDKVTKPDLFYLSYIVRKRLVNVPWRLARWMSKRATGTRDSSSLCGGQFVTRLARYFGLETQEEVGTCTVVQPGMSPLTIRKLEAMDIIESCSIYGGEPEQYFWVATTPVGQTIQSRQARITAAGGDAARGRERLVAETEVMLLSLISYSSSLLRWTSAILADLTSLSLCRGSTSTRLVLIWITRIACLLSCSVQPSYPTSLSSIRCHRSSFHHHHQSSQDHLITRPGHLIREDHPISTTAWMMRRRVIRMMIHPILILDC